MKRDFNLIREILLAVEMSPAGEVITTLNLNCAPDEPTAIEHVALMVDAGFLEGEVIRPDIISLRGLTYTGHDFLETIRNDSVWQKVLDTIRAKGGAITLETLSALAAEYAKRQLGI